MDKREALEFLDALENTVNAEDEILEALEDPDFVQSLERVFEITEEEGLNYILDEMGLTEQDAVKFLIFQGFITPEMIEEFVLTSTRRMR